MMELACDCSGGVVYCGVGFDCTRFWYADGGVVTDSAEVVTQEVDYHVEFGCVFLAVAEDVWVDRCGTCAFDWAGGDVAVFHFEEEFGRG